MKKLLFTYAFLLMVTSIHAQSLIIAGPMPGYTEISTSHIWVEVSKEVQKVNISYEQIPANENTRPIKHTINYDGPITQTFNPITFNLEGLYPDTKYTYTITATSGRRKETRSGTIKTQALLSKEKTMPDFSFLTGSCAYINDPDYDRSNKSYGGDSTIFLKMAEKGSDFMLWLGDNWYTRETDYNNVSGLNYRAHHDRSMEVMQPLLKAMPHYAIWDDHDYGPNDAGSSYTLKEESRDVFMKYWPNPSYGMYGKGIYTQFNYNDVAFLLLDDRTWRSNDAIKDSINGAINKEKQMFGKDQMKWLKESLLANRYATFKIIANGSQILNPVSPYDCLRHFGTEYTELMDFLKEYKINGVVFLTGDRHHSEIIKMEMPGFYTLYDITASPLTSHVYAPGGIEANIPERVQGTIVSEQNFSKISITGNKGNRTLNVQFFDINGNEKAKWSVKEGQLRLK